MMLFRILSSAGPLLLLLPGSRSSWYSSTFFLQIKLDILSRRYKLTRSQIATPLKLPMVTVLLLLTWIILCNTKYSNPSEIEVDRVSTSCLNNIIADDSCKTVSYSMAQRRTVINCLKNLWDKHKCKFNNSTLLNFILRFYKIF